MESIKTRIIEARKKTGLTQAEFSERWELSIQTLRQWEQGQRTPKGLYLKRIEKILSKIERGGIAEDQGSSSKS